MCLKKNGKDTRKYKVWSHMIERCYNKTERNWAYKDCTVCKEWHNFQNFAKWYDENYYEIGDETMHLDKDILIKGNREYRPENCCFVPQSINSLFIKSKKARGECPIGVHKSKSGLISRCSSQVFKNRVHLGTFRFDDELGAFEAYKTYKEMHIKEMADLYKNVIPTNVYKAMYNYVVMISD